MTIPFPTPDLNTPADLVSLLQQSSHLLQRVLAHHFAEFGLTEIRYEVLKSIRGNSDCTQSYLAGRLHQSESSISTLIERMRKDGLLFRLASESDRRKRVLVLSDKGSSILSRIETCHADRMRRLIGPVPESDLAQLTALMETLLGRLGQVAENIDTSLRFPWPAERMAA